MKGLPKITERMRDVLEALPLERGARRDERRLPGTSSTIIALEERGLADNEYVSVGTFAEHLEVWLTDKGAILRCYLEGVIGPNVARAAIEELEQEGTGPNVELTFRRIGR